MKVIGTNMESFIILIQIKISSPTTVSMIEVLLSKIRKHLYICIVTESNEEKLWIFNSSMKKS